MLDETYPSTTNLNTPPIQIHTTRTSHSLLGFYILGQGLRGSSYQVINSNLSKKSKQAIDLMTTCMVVPCTKWLLHQPLGPRWSHVWSVQCDWVEPRRIYGLSCQAELAHLSIFHDAQPSKGVFLSMPVLPPSDLPLSASMVATCPEQLRIFPGCLEPTWIQLAKHAPKMVLPMLYPKQQEQPFHYS